MNPLEGHVIVTDLGYGDAGKGRVVDRLGAGPDRDRPVSAVIRFNGGAQAAHNVITADGRHHTFAQFGSGTLQGVRTHLSHFVVVDPAALATEAAHLRTLGVPDPFGLLTVDAEALLVTPWHQAANRAREQSRGENRHGTCGMGVGETVAYALANPDAPRVGDTRDPIRLRRRLAQVRDGLQSQFPGDIDDVPLEAVARMLLGFAASVAIVDGERTRRELLNQGPCVFEGAQGVLLDEWFGWHPHTTWSTTTFANAVELLGGRDALRLGVVRTYTTRHGAGPHPTEDPALDLPELHNEGASGQGLSGQYLSGQGSGGQYLSEQGSGWQGAFRRGHFDVVAHRYAIEVAGGIDALAVTHLDAPARRQQLGICAAYRLADGRELTRIPVGTQGDLVGQERLTALLRDARPARLTHPPDTGSKTWAGEISDLLGAPVVLGSHGPRTTDGWLAAPDFAETA